MIILTGPSASGKTATCLYLQSHYGIRKVITHTTRPIRKGEKNNVDYHFVTVEEFLRLKEANAFIETVQFNGNYYGTSREEVKLDRCLAVEFNGAKTYASLQDPHIVIFLLTLDKKVRLARMQGRGDDPEKIRSRIENDEKCFTLDPSISRIIDCTIDTEKLGIPEVADTVYENYLRILKERNIRFVPPEEK